MPKKQKTRAPETGIKAARRKRTSQQLRKRNAQPEKGAAACKRALQAANDNLSVLSARLEAANSELESFAYSVSHDLRVPLRAIEGFTRIIIEDYGDRLDNEGLRLLKVVRDSAGRMSQLIDGLLTYSRIGQQEIAFGTMNMAALARLAADEVAQANAGRSVRVVIGDLPPARGDQGMLCQALINLISNSYKFTAPRPDPAIEIGYTARHGENWYYVKDNGVGFDMRYAGRLFGIFQRLHPREEFDGNGVGLAIVQRVIRRHGGKIQGQAEAGKGAVFYFSLPGVQTP